MIARPALIEDTDAIHRLVGDASDAQLDRDVFIVAGRPPFGVLIWRPCALVHEFEPGKGLARANVASSLVNFAIGHGVARAWPIRTVLFFVRRSNEAMLEYARRLGAVPEDGQVFTLELK